MYVYNLFLHFIPCTNEDINMSILALYTRIIIAHVPYLYVRIHTHIHTYIYIYIRMCVYLSNKTISMCIPFIHISMYVYIG